MSKHEARLEERSQRHYSFGDFTLDLERGFLRRGDAEITLAPKPFEVLTYLVTHHGKLVTKAALIEAVWQDTAVTDNSLAQCLFEIRRALGDDSQQLIRTIARRGYMFAAPVTTPVISFPRQLTADSGDSGPQAAPLPLTRKLPYSWIVASALFAAVLSTSFLAWQFRKPERAEPHRAVALTTLPGEELYPSLSPDGAHVAFTWNGSKQDNLDIYVQTIGSTSPLRLTTDSGADYNPVWSPDGRWIAFLRNESVSRYMQPARIELRLIPALGGPERKISEIRTREVYYEPANLAWCPDSNCLVVTDSPGPDQPDSLFLVSLETGEKRQLTDPQTPVLDDTNPAVSPDGRSLVFRREVGYAAAEIHWLPLGNGLTAAGQTKRLTDGSLNASFPAWMPDGKEILFSAQGRLWRLTVSGGGGPAPLPFVGVDGLMPIVATPRRDRPSRLVYARSLDDWSICRLETAALGAPASSPPAPAISSTGRNTSPQFSPDGRRVAFASNRSGEFEIWVADVDGSSPVQLTSMRTGTTGTPRWSPDGQTIAFDSNPEGQYEIYLVPAAGGKPRRLTSDPASDHVPSFSRDGKRVYFTSNRTGHYQIWKVPVSGGEAVQVTQNGGQVAFESVDGSYLYYTQSLRTPSPLWRIPASGGKPERILDGVVWRAFFPLKSGIYYIGQTSGPPELQFFDFGTGISKTVARNLGNLRVGLTAAPDGRTILYSRVHASSSDLMLVENFR
jgi:eukaryotic-like serine/threonine-protein kinase